MFFYLILLIFINYNPHTSVNNYYMSRNFHQQDQDEIVGGAHNILVNFFISFLVCFNYIIDVFLILNC